MRTIPSGFLDGPVTDLQVCWLVTRRDGIQLLGTECDTDISITTGNYTGVYLAAAGIRGSDVRTNSDLSVSNIEVEGALVPSTAFLDSSSESDSSGSLTLLDISAADIEAGLLDNAEAVTFLVNRTDPDLHQHVLKSGWLGNTNRTAEGAVKTELRGLEQALSQGIVRTYGVGCDAELGDSRCKVDMTAHTFTRTVGAVTSRRQFQISTPGIGPVVGGKVTWLSGANAGYTMEIKSGDVSLQIELYLPMPNDIQIGDSLTLTRGCDKALLTCINSYNNLPNFRGHGVLVPGDAEVLKIGKR